jgi:hypothetical protein
MNDNNKGLDVHGHIEMRCANCGRVHEGYCHKWQPIIALLIVLVPCGIALALVLRIAS